MLDHLSGCGSLGPAPGGERHLQPAATSTHDGEGAPGGGYTGVVGEEDREGEKGVGEHKIEQEREQEREEERDKLSNGGKDREGSATG